MSDLTRRATLAALSFAFAGPAKAISLIPSSDLLGQEWTRTGADGDPDYGVWAEFLTVYVHPRVGAPSLVDYGGALGDGAEKALAAWLRETQAINPATLSKPAQRAWWINLYNAATVDLVLRYYPVASIRHIEGGLFNLGPWDEDILMVNGHRLSLNDVEHGILRPIWNDPRTHYAVNCAAIGCPDLEATPWRADDMEARLNAAARRYVNHPRGARVESGELIISSIYSWFSDDFGGTDANVIRHLRDHADAPLLAALVGRTRIDDNDYNWAVNASPAGQD
jgi:hypothetical protein